MKPAAFEYFRPDTVAEAVQLLERYGPEARVLAGGQSLVPAMNFRLAQPRCLVDLGRIDELSFVREENGGMRVGAMVRQSTIEDSPLLAERCPLLPEATRFVGHRTIRNRGTIGGSLAHADPSAEYPTVLTALDGDLRAMGPRGTRTIPAADFYLTFFTTALAPDELLVEVRVPAIPPGTGCAFVELSRRHGDYAIVGVAAVVSIEESGLCNDARIVLAGVGQTPVRCEEAERMLRWSSPNPELIQEVCASCAAASQPIDDLHASASYKEAMVEVFVERALRSALRRARRSEHVA